MPLDLFFGCINCSLVKSFGFPLVALFGFNGLPGNDNVKISYLYTHWVEWAKGIHMPYKCRSDHIYTPVHWCAQAGTRADICLLTLKKKRIFIKYIVWNLTNDSLKSDNDCLTRTTNCTLNHICTWCMISYNHLL